MTVSDEIKKWQAIYDTYTAEKAIYDAARDEYNVLI